MGANYQLARSNNYSNGAFALPANNYDLEAEWGPSLQDVRHRYFGMVNFGVPRAMRLGVFAQGSRRRPTTSSRASTPTAIRSSAIGPTASSATRHAARPPGTSTRV